MDYLIHMFQNNNMKYLENLDLSWNLLDNQSFISFCECIFICQCYSLKYLSFNSNIPLESEETIHTLDNLLIDILENRLFSIKVIDLYGNGITYDQTLKFISESKQLIPHLLCRFRSIIYLYRLYN